MELNKITKDAVKKNRKYFSTETPNWEAFFDAIPAAERGVVASDFYNYMEELDLGNFLEHLTYLPDRMFAGSNIIDITLPENIKEIG